MQMASRFASRSPVLRSAHPLSDEQIRAVAPSIFAPAAHDSRSPRYSYIPTATVLDKLREEGFQPFMVCQTRVRADDRRDYTKHMIRLRHASQINGSEANEVVLLNSHDGTSSYQMLAGMFRFVCQNGLVCGDTVADVRVPHKGDVAAQVIEGAYEVLHGFDRAQASRDAMRAVTLDAGEAQVFARAALALKYDEDLVAPDAALRQAGIRTLGQRCRVHRRQGHALVARLGHRAGLHRAGKLLAKRHRRELQRQAARRAAQSKVPQPRRGAGADRTMAAVPQRTTTPPRPSLSAAGDDAPSVARNG